MLLLGRGIKSLSNKLRNLSINRKMLMILLVSSLLPVLVAGFLLIELELSEFQKTAEEDLTSLAKIIGSRSTTALIIKDQGMATEVLEAFNNIPAVQITCLYNSQNEVFTLSVKKPRSNYTCPENINKEFTRFEKKAFIAVQPIAGDQKKLGMVYIRADLSAAYWRKIQFVGVLFLILVVVSLVAFLIAQPLLRLISRPIQGLVSTVKKISDSHDYSLRAAKHSNDETGKLIDCFNDLIQTVETQNQALTTAKNRYRTLYDDNPTMVFNISTEGIIFSANLTGAKQLGLSIEELQNCSVFNFVDPDDTSLMQELITRCVTAPLLVHNQEFRFVCHNSRVIWIRATARLLENEIFESSLLIVCEDITETRELNAKITHQANHDALTGLANRSKFDRYLKRAIATAHQENTEHTLCYLDLDQFKVVNDSCGHLAGDELLRQLGDLLQTNIRHNDFVARLGGDEFGIIMYNCSLSHAYFACEKLRDTIKDFSFAWEDRSFTVGVSIGVASINVASGNAVDLLKEADAACYAAKEKGRNRVHVFSPDDEELALRRGEMQWVEKIHQGLEQQRFVLYGQPIVAINQPEDGLHFEALLRYRDDRGNIIPPGAFLPAAERYNLAAQLDRWLIASLLEWLSERPSFLKSLTLCSVNLSGLTISDETIVSYIIDQFERWQIPTHKLCFEITETAAISNLSQATHFIHRLKDKGCLFSLDDFGSGLSSFAYLKHLPVDFLKIDGLFVKDILDDEVDLAMVKSINEVGHVMNKKTIAEFVENKQIFDLLKTLGIDYAQGYGIGKPLPIADLKPISQLFGVPHPPEPIKLAL
jgi:diguanylate cyclase (GGDEF)-like protein/PAS domain S-box-containing protein